MKLRHLLSIIMILAVPFFGMAQMDSVATAVISNTNPDSLFFGSTTEVERDTDIYYKNGQNSESEYIYVTEYEEEKKWIDRVISRFLRTSVDSNYITTNDYGLQVKLSFNTFNSQTKFKWEATEDTLPNYCRISSDQISKIGLWIGYRNFGLGYSFELGSFSKNKIQYNSEFSFDYYGDAWGIGVCLNYTGDNNLYFNKVHADIPDNFLGILRLQLNTYCAPLYQKFSYNAAFSHSMRQEKSAGSPLFGLSMNSFWLYSSHYLDPEEFSYILDNDVWQIPSQIRYFGINMNAGYAHNFVTKKKTLLHISLLPYITLFKRTSVKSMYENGDKEPLFQYGATGKTSWIWQREHHLISVFGSINFNSLLQSPIKVNDIVYRVGTCYGFRAYKHHKPHKKKRVKRKCDNKLSVSQQE